MKEIDAYLAGFFDGEGTIYRIKDGRYQLSVSQNDKRPEELLIKGLDITPSTMVG